MMEKTEIAKEYDVQNDQDDEGDIDSTDDKRTVKPKKTKNQHTYFLCQKFYQKMRIYKGWEV